MFAQAERCEQKMIELLRPSVTGEEVKQFSQILSEAFAAGEKPQITVDSGGARIVVAGG